MRYPKKIQILGEWVTVKIDPDLADNGVYYHDSQLIILREQESDLMARTLLHEVIHAVLAISGWSDKLGAKTEEGVCRAVETLWTLYGLKPSGKNIKWTKKQS